MKKYLSTLVILITVIFLDFLNGMEFDLFSPSLPQIRHFFHLTTFSAEGLLSVNFIGFCISLFIFGKLADQYSRKSVILIGLGIFIVGSIFSLIEQHYVFLLLGRLLQGVGIAAPAISSFLIIADRFPLKEQQFYMALLNGSANVATAIAPVIGSYVALYFHWQGNFTALLILGIIAFVMTLFLIPNYKTPKDHETQSISSYSSLLKSKSLMTLIFYLAIMFTPYWVFVGMSPLLYIKHFGVSLNHFGYYQGALAFVFAIGSVIFGFFISRHTSKVLLFVSQYIFAMSLIAMLLLSVFIEPNPLLITLAMLIFVVGQIIPSAILYPVCVNFIPEAKAKISALIQGLRLVLSALCVQTAGYFYDHTFKSVGIIMSGLIVVTLFLQFYISTNKQENYLIS